MNFGNPASIHGELPCLKESLRAAADKELPCSRGHRPGWMKERIRFGSYDYFVFFR